MRRVLIVACFIAAFAMPVQAQKVNPYGQGPGVATYALATPITGSSANVANASAVATLAAAAGKMTYITGFQCTASGATAGADVTVTVAGVVGGTMNYTQTAPTGATLGAYPLIVPFSHPIPASAINTAIVVTMPALGTGNTNATCAAQGFQL